MIPSGIKEGKLYSFRPNDGTGDFTVSRNSTATYVDEDGLIKTALANVPRIDWSTGEAALLVEPQSTNILDKNTPNALIGVSLDGIVADPTGGNNARAYSKTGPDTLIRFGSVDTPLTESVKVASVWVRSYSGTAQIRLDSQDNNGTIFNISEQWQRIEVNSLGRTTDQGFMDVEEVTGTIHLWAPQLEQGTKATSTIVIGNSSVTRLADNISVPTPAGVTAITETIDGVDQTPITTIPATYSLPVGNINKVTML